MGLFNLLRKKKDNEFSEKKYLNTVLSNGKTIGKQREYDLQQASGNFDNSIKTYYGMHIVSNVTPPIKNYNILNNDEKLFFEEFSKQLINNKYSPDKIKLTRLSNGTFNVEHTSLAYVGKINLYKKPTRFAVKKEKNKRPTKIFDSPEEANELACTNPEFKIITLEGESNYYMQYMIGLYNIKEVNNQPLEVMIATIPRWIKYLNYCKRN